MELLDIVDENDTVIGRGTRKSVHGNYQIHRGVHVFVINSTGEILIQKRSNEKNDRPGFLDASCGAQVTSGETYEQAAQRETKEELGIKVKKLVYIGKYKSFSERQREIRTLFITKNDGPFDIEKHEVEKVEFMTVRKIQKIIHKNLIPFTEGFKRSLKLYLTFLKRN
jgi:isopentenyl-diphosphate delta-isomerase